MANEIGSTELVATQQDLVSSIVQETLKTKAVLIPTITDFSSMAVKGAKSVAIPRRTQLAAADKTENTDLVAQEITFATDVIDLDKKKAIFAKIERIPEFQSNVNVQAQLIQEMADELALQVDKDIITELQAASAAAPDHIIDFDDVSNVLFKVDILEARRLILTQDIMMDDNWFMGMSPTREKELLNIADFIRADAIGSPAGLITGVVGRVFNFKVMIHNQIPVDEVLFWHKSAVGYATQQNTQFDTDKDLKAVSDEFLMFQVYGVKTLDLGVRQVKLNSSGA